MCKYSYISGACANRRVDSLHCIGEDKCDYSDMNILCPSDTKDSAAERWKDLYCDTHRRFLCDGGPPSNDGPSRIPPGTGGFRQGRLFNDGSGRW